MRPYGLRTDGTDALTIAKRIQEEIRKLAIVHLQSEVSIHITLSLGIASTIPVRGQSPDRLVKTADEALYEIKKHCRNDCRLKQV